MSKLDSRRAFLKGTLTIGVGSILMPNAQANNKENSGFSEVLNPQTPVNPRKIEVLEFFSYTCPHCYNLEKTITPWARTLPKSVEFSRVPVSFSPAMKPFAKIYYTLKDMGILDKYHERVFKAFQIEKVPLYEPTALFKWVQSQGIDQKEFESVYNLQAVDYQVQKADSLAEIYAINAVPTFIVAGKYQTSVAQAGSPDLLIKTINRLTVTAIKPN